MHAPVTTTRLPSEYGFSSSVLRQSIGFGRRFMPSPFASALGKPVSTIKSWLLGKTSPSLDRLPDLEKVGGEQLIRDLLAQLGYFGAFKVGEKSPCPNKHATALAAALTELSRALEDQRIDHREAATLAPILRKLSSESAAFAADLSKRVG